MEDQIKLNRIKRVLLQKLPDATTVLMVMAIISGPIPFRNPTPTALPIVCKGQP